MTDPMAAKTEVPVSPRVLDWAIHEGGYSLDEFAARVDVEIDELRAWLDGYERPGRTEFGRIVNILKRPSAVFFMPEPPEKAGVPTRLRSQPGGGRQLSPEELRAIRSSRRMQALLSHWRRKSGLHHPVDMPRIQAGTPVELAGATLRAWTDVTVDDQLEWRSEREGFSVWKRRLSEQGIATVQLSLGPNGIRGFSSWDDYLPMVAVNTNYNVAARIYTLFHELAHLTSREEAACGDVLPGAPAIERWCETVAAAALLPANAVRAFLLDAVWEDALSLASDVANAFCVSVRSSAIRLTDLEVVERDGALAAFLNTTAGSMDRTKDFVPGSRPADRVDLRIRRWGSDLLSEFDAALKAGFLDERDMRDYLDLDVVEFEEAKARIASEG